MSFKVAKGRGVGAGPSPAMLRANYDALLDMGHELLGFDPMILVNVGLMVGAVAAFLHYMGRSAYSYAKKLVLSSVHINEDDALYGHVMRYVSDKQLASQGFRSVKATTPTTTTWEDEEDAARSQAGETGSFDRNKLISYRMAISRVPVRLAPFEGNHLFRHGGRWLLFSHKLHRQGMLDVYTGSRERGYITLSCLGRSLTPLRQFLDDAQVHALERSQGTTNIYRGMTGNRGGDQLHWQVVLSRPARDIRTVILDRQKKSGLLADINEYLHPHSRRWYANRGIPYRRGYLFSGVPGMGKTSLTAALAGVFGLDIYVLSLLDPALTESQLMRLLGNVPSRCIVLLEDVDAAGLNRPGGDGKGVAATVGDKAKSRGANAASARFRNRGGAKESAEPSAEEQVALIASGAGLDGGAPTAPVSSISLSGLLNAIDGVSSHEGHILIMTTNNPDRLDRALVRPGRVDMHINFELPRRNEARALFLSMYRDLKLKPTEHHDDDEEKSKARLANSNNSNENTISNGLKPLVNGITSSSFTNTATTMSPPTTAHPNISNTSSTSNTSNTSSTSSEHVSAFEFEAGPELSTLADRFADALPEQTLSLATIQGFLLRYKYDPELACERAGKWARQTVRDAEGEGGDDDGDDGGESSGDKNGDSNDKSDEKGDEKTVNVNVNVNGH